MNHWHIYRVTLAGEIGPDNTLDFNMEFYRDCFVSTRDAACNLAIDVVNRYPAAARVPSLRNAPNVMGARPDTAFRFKTDQGDLVVWYLLECEGRCQETFDRTSRTMSEQITARFGVPVIT